MSSFKKTFKLSRAAATNSSTEPIASSSSRTSSSSSSGSKAGGTAAGRGLKVWLNGQRLASSGHRQLDELLGGGCLLGTSILLETDAYSNYGDTLMAYFMAEALSNDQYVVLVTDTSRAAKDLINLMPFNLTLADEIVHAEMSAVALEDDERMNGKKEKKEEETALRIAWQYEKYATKDKEQQQLSSKDSFCCSYDLARKAQDTIRNSTQLMCICLQDYPSSSSSTTTASAPSDLSSYLNFCLHRISQTLKSLQDSSRTVRVILPSLISIHLSSELIHPASQTLVARTLLRLRHRIRESDAILLLSYLPQLIPLQLHTAITTIADTQLKIESFAGVADSVPSEFREFCGLLCVGRVQSIGALAPHRPQAQKYGLKRDRRKLHIEPLHLPPEESRAFPTLTQLSLVKNEGQGDTSKNNFATTTVLEPGSSCSTRANGGGYSLNSSSLEF